MNRLRTLFLGGTGIISSACVSEALAAGYEVTVVNRGTTTHRPLPHGVRVITADVRDPNSLDPALVARRRNTDGVSPALDSPGCVQNARRSFRLRLRFSPGQMTPMTRRHPRPISATDH